MLIRVDGVETEIDVLDVIKKIDDKRSCDWNKIYCRNSY